MATFVLIHGGAHGGSCWDLLVPELEARGHDVVAPDLPIDDDAAGLDAQAQAVIDAIGDRGDLVVVAHSLGGLVAPVVCTRRRVDLLVMLAAMVPAPAETCFELWERTGYAPVVDGEPVPDTAEAMQAAEPADGAALSKAGAIAAFYHDVPHDVALDAVSKLRTQSLTVFTEPNPIEGWPAVPTRYILCRDDRVVSADWARRVVRDRLGIEPDEIDGSHSPFLSRPAELADLLESLRVQERSATLESVERSSATTASTVRRR